MVPSVMLRDVTEIRKGQKTSTFESNLRNSSVGPHLELNRHLSCSIVYGGVSDTQTVDLVMKDETDFDVWTNGLPVIINALKKEDSEASYLGDRE